MARSIFTIFRITQMLFLNGNTKIHKYFVLYREGCGKKVPIPVFYGYL